MPTGTIIALAAALLAGCAADTFRREPGFDPWIRGVASTCENARIGMTTVGRLLRNPGSSDGGSFMNLTSRLYAGSVTPEQWRSGVVGFSSGGPNDPGLQCVLDQLPKR
jgi:hypothetical protein